MGSFYISWNRLNFRYTDTSDQVKRFGAKGQPAYDFVTAAGSISID